MSRLTFPIIAGIVHGKLDVFMLFSTTLTIFGLQCTIEGSASHLITKAGEHPLYRLVIDVRVYDTLTLLVSMCLEMLPLLFC